MEAMTPLTRAALARVPLTVPEVERRSNMNRADDVRAAYPLFQGERGGSTPTSALFRIREISHKLAKEWVETWHYSKRMPTGKNLCYGLFVNGSLYAVIVYGIGVNPYQASSLGVKSVLEIKRMCRSEPRLAYPLSRFIAISLRFVLKIFPAECIVAFADPQHGHEGTVYKASGFTRHGLTNAEWHLVGPDGEVRHRRFAFRHARRNGISLDESRKALGLERVKTVPKIRWVLRTQP
jgi:hypothetical protein